MREIKFRAFDNKRKRMVYNISFMYDKDDSFNCMYDENGLSIEDKFVTQYTGLKDKNGIKIYEGDIIKVTVEMIGMRILGKVVFQEAMFCCITPILPNDSIPLYGVDEIEIVGNIYQNPELLELK